MSEIDSQHLEGKAPIVCTAPQRTEIGDGFGPAGQGSSKPRRGALMRIRYKVALVGGIPITIAAAIAVIAWLLLSAAERTRNGAVLAGAVYRDLLGA